MAASQHRVDGEHIYDGMVLTGSMHRITFDRIRQTVFDDSDVVLVSYPKTGTTLMKEIMYLIQTNGDFKTSDTVPILSRIPYIDIIIPTKNDTHQFLEESLKTKPPRLISSHLPARYFQESLKNSSAKFVVVMRNPKDTLVSLYHFYRMHEGLNCFSGTWDEFFTMFEQDRLLYGSFFEHVRDWWELRQNPNILIVKFEDILSQPSATVRQVASHIQKELSDDLVSRIVDRISFDTMKNISTLNFSTFRRMNQNISLFMRKGQVGDWQNYFNDHQNKIVENLYRTHCEEKGLVFEFDNGNSKI